MAERAQTDPGAVRLHLDVPAVVVHQHAPPPDLLTQKNIEATTGIGASLYLEIIRRPDFAPAVTKIGQLRIVKRTAFLAWIDGLAESTRAAILPQQRPANDTPPTTAAGVVAEVIAARNAPPARRSRTRRTSAGTGT